MTTSSRLQSGPSSPHSSCSAATFAWTSTTLPGSIFGRLPPQHILLACTRRIPISILTPLRARGGGDCTGCSLSQRGMLDNWREAEAVTDTTTERMHYKDTDLCPFTRLSTFPQSTKTQPRASSCLASSILSTSSDHSTTRL